MMYNERPLDLTDEEVRRALTGATSFLRPMRKRPQGNDIRILRRSSSWLYHGSRRVTYGRGPAPDDRYEQTTICQPYGQPCVYGQVPGDRLWVRETWGDVNLHGAPGIAYRADSHVRDLMKESDLLCRRDRSFNYKDPRVKDLGFAVWFDDLLSGADPGWRRANQMPRWLSRIALEIIDVRPNLRPGGWYWVLDVRRVK